MITKNWIILGVAVSAILAYTVGIPPSFSAEYTRGTHFTGSENNCGNSETNDLTRPVDPIPPGNPRAPPPDYEPLVDNTVDNTIDNTVDSTVDNTATYCSNANSQVQGDENTGAISSTQH
jgi:hypothetical protein